MAATRHPDLKLPLRKIVVYINEGFDGGGGYGGGGEKGLEKDFERGMAI